MMKRAIAAYRRYCACMLLALGCALAAFSAVADGTEDKRLVVWAIGLPHGGYVVMEHQAPTIRVTARDVENGVVEVSGGSRFAITTAAPAGYTVDFATRGAWCRGVVIDGIGSTTELGPRGGTVVQREPAAGKRVVAVNYRFVLAPDAIPGNYPWPLEMVVREVAAGDVERPAAARRLVTISGRDL